MPHCGPEGMLEAVHKAAARRQEKTAPQKSNKKFSGLVSGCGCGLPYAHLSAAVKDVASFANFAARATSTPKTQTCAGLVAATPPTQLHCSKYTHLNRPFLDLEVFLAGASILPALLLLHVKAWSAAEVVSMGLGPASCVPKFTVVAVLPAKGPMWLLNTSMLTVCLRPARAGLDTVSVALKCDASLQMLMEVVEVAPASPLPAGMPAKAAARGVRGV